MPRPHRVRKRLLSKPRKWHDYASNHFEESSIYEDGDGDPYWGSQFTRNRRNMIKNAGGHDVDAIAALDLGLCFGLVTNTSPATLLAVWHIFKDPSLLQRVRSELTDRAGKRNIREVDLQSILQIPLLQSVYAETLRLYTKIYIMVSSPHTDVPLGRWSLPRNSIGLVNSAYPTGTPTSGTLATADPMSGPINPAILEGQGHSRTRRNFDGGTEDSPFFSMDGLEASWFPYGGGFSVCPGRHMAKACILYTCALLAHEFDIEFLTESLVLDNWRFGLGVQGPTNDLRFRIRKRENIM